MSSDSTEPMNFPRVIDIAWTRACDGLGLPRGTRLAADEASVLLKYVAAEVAGIPGAPVATAACRARQALRPWIETGLASLQHVLADGALASVGRALLDDRFYAGRIVDLTVADLVSEPMAPEVCIDPDPWLGLPAGYAGWHHGVVFCVAPLITHELYPLAVDAGAAARVLGVHGDWLSGARAERVIILDPSRDRFREASLTTPVELDSAHLLALGKREHERHRCWAASLPCPLVNPWPAAALADDKHALLQRWRRLGLEVPQGALLQPGDRLGARRFLEGTPQIVAKPNAGADGERVLFLDASDDDAVELLNAHLASCWEWGPVRIEQRRDAVAWRDPETERVHSLCLRLHVGRGTNGPLTESGYAQVGVDAATPAAPGRGGLRLPLAVAAQSLVRRDTLAPMHLRAEDLEALRSLAAAALEPVADLGLGGIDVVLDISPDGGLLPVLLELNPRPLGLSHARFLPGCGHGRGEAGVSLAMWDDIAQRSAALASIAEPAAAV